MRPKRLTPEQKIESIMEAIDAMIARENRNIVIWGSEGNTERHDYAMVRWTAMVELRDAIKMAEIGRFEGYV